MTKPEYFDVTEVLAGLHSAMEFGAPVTPGDRATFYTRNAPEDAVATDDEGVPLVATNRATPTYTQLQVPCAVEYEDGREISDGFGLVQASRVTLTLLGPDYVQVAGFEYVAIGGEKYLYRTTEPVIALGNIDVWTVHCQSEDET